MILANSVNTTNLKKKLPIARINGNFDTLLKFITFVYYKLFNLRNF